MEETGSNVPVYRETKYGFFQLRMIRGFVSCLPAPRKTRYILPCHCRDQNWLFDSCRRGGWFQSHYPKTRSGLSHNLISPRRKECLRSSRQGENRYWSLTVSRKTERVRRLSPSLTSRGKMSVLPPIF